jgi:hypothetical protein
MRTRWPKKRFGGFTTAFRDGEDSVGYVFFAMQKPGTS